MKIDPWYARLYGTDGRVYCTWRLHREFIASLPQKLRHDSNRNFTVDRVEFLDEIERPLFSWTPQQNYFMLRSGDSFELRIDEITL